MVDGGMESIGKIKGGIFMKKPFIFIGVGIFIIIAALLVNVNDIKQPDKNSNSSKVSEISQSLDLSYDISDVAINNLVYRDYQLGRKEFGGTVTITKDSLLKLVKDPKKVVVIYNDQVYDTIFYDDRDIVVDFPMEGMYCYIAIDKNNLCPLIN